MDRDAFIYIQQLFNDIKNGLNNVKLEAPTSSGSPNEKISGEDNPVMVKNYWELLNDDIGKLDCILQSTKALPVLGNTRLQLSSEHIKDTVIPTLSDLQSQLFAFHWDSENSKEEFDAIMLLAEKLGLQLFPPQPKVSRRK